MDFIEIKLEGAWDIILLIGTLIAIITSGNLVIKFIRSLLQKNTETNKLDTIKIVQQQVDLLESQIQSLTTEIKRLFTSGEESRLHKIELMKTNLALYDTVDKLKRENKDLNIQNELLQEQNVLLTEQIKELKTSKELLKKELDLLKNENLKLKKP